MNNSVHCYFIHFRVTNPLPVFTPLQPVRSPFQGPIHAKVRRNALHMPSVISPTPHPRSASVCVDPDMLQLQLQRTTRRSVIRLHKN